MNISISRSELKEAVAGFTKIVNGKSHTLPILGCVRFENSSHGLMAQVTDLDQHLGYHFKDARAEGDGACILPLVNLKDLIHGNAQEKVEFETGDKGNVTVTNHVGDHVVRHPVQGLDLDEWPACPEDVVTQPASGFLETYRRLVPFASTDNTRYLLNGVYVDVAETGEHPVTMVATDGRRLSLWNSMNLPLPQSAIIPTTKFLTWKDLQGEAEIGLRTARVKNETVVKAIAVRIGPWSYDVKAIEGQYPRFRQVIPSQPGPEANRITFTDADAAALRKILPSFPGHDGQNEGIGLGSGANGTLVISGRGTDDAAATTLELTGGSRCEGGMPVGVNRDFLVEALEAGFRVFTYANEMCPLMSVDGRGGIHVLMPLRLGHETPKQAEPQKEPEKGGGVTDTPGQESRIETTPAVLPADKPKGEKQTMTKENENGTTEQGSALDKVLASVETAKGKLKEAVTSLSEVAEAVKVAVKEGKAQVGDLEKARATLQKLQAISL